MRRLLVPVLALVALAASNHPFVAVSPGVRLFVQEEGHGAPVIVVHGGPGLDMSYFVDDLAPLARAHRLIFYDQRGSGRSTVTLDVSPDNLVADLERLREHFRFEKLTILGHSWGAGLAALYTIAHPDRVERLLLVDAMPPRAAQLRDFGRILRGRLTSAEQVALDAAERARDTARTDEEIVASCQSYWNVLEKAYYADPTAVAKSRARLCSAPPAALANGDHVNVAVLSALGDYDWRPALGRIAAPTLIVHGDRDPVPLDAAREWAAALPNARLLVLPDSGHMSYVEQPDLFFGAANVFLAGRWPKDAAKP